MLFLLLAMSVLRAIWEPAAPATLKTKGHIKRAEMEHLMGDRERSPRRRCGVKAMLKSWAKGENSTSSVWRLCHAIVTQDGTDAGLGMNRLAGLGTYTCGIEQNCARKTNDLMAETALPKMVVPIRRPGRSPDYTLHPPNRADPSATQLWPAQVRPDLGCR